jgi:hypothetical protein
MGIGSYFIVGETTVAARDGHGSMTYGVILGILFTLFFLGIWLGCAAIVGWFKQND